MATLYETFRASFGRDGADFSIVKRAKGAARDQLEEALIANLGPIQAMALGMMKSRAAVPHIEAALAADTSTDRLQYARALWQLTDDPHYIAIIARAIADRQTTEAYERGFAAGLLGGVKHPDAFAALEVGILDPEHAVRRQAANVYAHNSAGKTSFDTIERNVRDYDESRLAKLIDKLRAKNAPRAG